MSALTDYESVYKELADNYALAEDNEPYADEHMYNAFLVIIDLTNATNDSATNITLHLSDPIYRAYVATVKYFQKIGRVLVSVTAINDYVTKVLGGDLTEFVNAIPWDGGCVPTSWADLCEETGVDTSGWTIC